MDYDIESWIDAGSPSDPTPFRLPGRTLVRFVLDESYSRELHAALQSWTDSLKGLKKLVTRIQVVWQERRCHILADLEERASAAVAG